MVRFFVVATLLSLAFIVSSASVTTVTVDWTNVTFISKTLTTLQLVNNPLILRQSPIHDAVYRNLKHLNTTHARYASWYPYPKLSVPELDPPSGLSQCRNVGVGYEAALSCERSGGVIDKVEFASFGTPDGVCRSFAVNTNYTSASSLDVVTKLCVGQRNCSIPATTALFGSPCPGQEASYRLAVQVTCNPPQNNTYWDFSHFDAPVIDFLEATRGGQPIVEFCTSPSWLYDQSDQPIHHYPDNPLAVDWGYNTGSRLVDPTCEQIGQWYGRLAAWYTQGGFTDEYGYFHHSGHKYQLDVWEVLNEMEHGLDIHTYICIYDAVVKYVREYADPTHRIAFVGLAELDAANFNDYTVFLNTSNHAPNTPLDWISYHRYASSNSRTNTSSYESFFDQYDEFFTIVTQIETIRNHLSPHTRTTIDEIGVILPNDNDPSAEPFPTIYWNAVSASFAYLFGHLSGMGIDVIGSSQLVGYPQLSNVSELGDLSPQYPSVSMTNWTTGAGTARVWLLDLLIRSFSVGDKLVATLLSNTSDVYAQAYIGTSHRGEVVHKVLLVNKRQSEQSVSVVGAAGGEMETVDETSGERPARRSELSSDSIVMTPFAVSVVRLPKSSASTIVAVE